MNNPVVKLPLSIALITKGKTDLVFSRARHILGRWSCVAGSVLCLLCLLINSGCAYYAYNNRRLHPEDIYQVTRATFDISDSRGRDDVLVLMALSGGGSRAAYFSTSVMFKLQNFFKDIDLLKEVDAISSVSGGSLAAAYYCVTADKRKSLTVRIMGGLDVSGLQDQVLEKIVYQSEKGLLGFIGRMTDAERLAIEKALTDSSDVPKIARLQQYSITESLSRDVWEEERVKDLMQRNFQLRWFGRWFYPHNIARYWLTSFDRSDIMAQTFSANLFRTYSLRWDMRFSDLNPERPYLLLNATDATEDYCPEPVQETSCETDEPRFGQPFIFTTEDFRKKLDSDIQQYRLANAVMASAAFPGAFNFVTLRDFRAKGEDNVKHVHVFDGGNSDNLGLNTLRKVIDLNLNRYPGRYRSIVILIVDSYIRPRGIESWRFDARGVLSYIIDFNFMNTFDSLLTANRKQQLKDLELFKDSLIEEKGIDVRVVHFTFQDIDDNPELKRRLDTIPTRFKIAAEHARWIDEAVDILFEQKRTELEDVRRQLDKH